MAPKHTAFLDLEETLAARFRQAWTRYWNKLAAQIVHSCAQRDWDTAHRLAESLDLTPIFERQKIFARTVGMSALLLGASRITAPQKSTLRKHPPKQRLENYLAQMHTLLTKNASQALRQLAHEWVAAEEAKLLKADERIQKFNVEVTDRNQTKINVAGKNYFGLASSVQISRLSAYGFLVEAVEAGLQNYRVDAVLDERTCEVCRHMDGWVFPLEAGVQQAQLLLDTSDPEALKTLAPFYAQNKASLAALAGYTTEDFIHEGMHLPPYHPLCLVGETEITASPKIAAATKRWFEGEVFVVTTASKKQITITANHPILTRRGWIAPKLLKVGEDALCCLRRDGAVPRVDDHQHMPASIAEIADSFFASSRVTTREVPATTEDFHGDGGQGEVAVIGADGLLWLRRQAQRTQTLIQRFLVGAAGRGVLGLCSRHLALAAEGHSGAPDGFMSRHYLPLPLGDGHALPFSSLSFAGGAQGDVRVPEPTLDDVARDAKLAAELQNGFAGPVAFDDVVNVEVKAFAGHVYNLETEGGWYAAESIIVHNCRCILTPTDEPADVHPSDVAERTMLASQALYGEGEGVRLTRELFGVLEPPQAERTRRLGDVMPTMEPEEDRRVAWLQGVLSEPSEEEQQVPDWISELVQDWLTQPAAAVDTAALITPQPFEGTTIPQEYAAPFSPSRLRRAAEMRWPWLAGILGWLALDRGDQVLTDDPELVAEEELADEERDERDELREDRRR